VLEALLNFFDCLGEDLADLRVQRDRRLDAGGIEDICKTPQPNAFKAENVLVGIRHEKEGKLRVTYTRWDDAKVVLDGQVLELRWGPLSPASGRGCCAEQRDERGLIILLADKELCPPHRCCRSAGSGFHCRLGGPRREERIRDLFR